MRTMKRLLFIGLLAAPLWCRAEQISVISLTAQLGSSTLSTNNSSLTIADLTSSGGWEVNARLSVNQTVNSSFYSPVELTATGVTAECIITSCSATNLIFSTTITDIASTSPFPTSLFGVAVSGAGSESLTGLWNIANGNGNYTLTAPAYSYLLNGIQFPGNNTNNINNTNNTNNGNSLHTYQLPMSEQLDLPSAANGTTLSFSEAELAFGEDDLTLTSTSTSPEPASFALAALGAALLILLVRRRPAR